MPDARTDAQGLGGERAGPRRGTASGGNLGAGRVGEDGEAGEAGEAKEEHRARDEKRLTAA